MADQVLLKYKRVDKEHVAGEIVRGDEQLFRFESLTFDAMMRELSKHAVEHPTAEVAMQRIDRAGLTPHTLDAGTAKLLREHPNSVIQMMTVVVTVPSDRPTRTAAPVLVAGQNVLADAFGDRLYCRRRQRPVDEVECPLCGRWATLRSVEGWSWFDHCGYTISIETHLLDERWFPISTEALLVLNTPKFFFPRAWNEGRNWIEKEALQRRYDAYLQEKNAS